MSDELFANKPLEARRSVGLGGAGPIELSIVTIGEGFDGVTSVAHKLTPQEAFELARALEHRAYSIIVADCQRAGVEAPELTGGIEGIEGKRSLMMERGFFMAIGGVRDWFETIIGKRVELEQGEGLNRQGAVWTIVPKDAGRMFGGMMNAIVEGVAKDGDAAKPLIEQIAAFVRSFHAIGVRGGTERLHFVAGMMEAVGAWSKEGGR